MLDNIYEITQSLINKRIDSNSKIFELKTKSGQQNSSISGSQSTVSSIGSDVLNTLLDKINRLESLIAPWQIVFTTLKKIIVLTIAFCILTF